MWGFFCEVKLAVAVSFIFCDRVESMTECFVVSIDMTSFAGHCLHQSDCDSK